MVRVFEVVGDVLGPRALDDIYVAARSVPDLANTLWLDEFAGLRQRHSDWLDQLAAENPPERWDPLSESRRDSFVRDEHSDLRHKSNGPSVDATLWSLGIGIS
ncbi:MAG: hypothetical protein ACI9N0_003005 [Ilumatobacter sp.]|jgi:hypothetical protein